MSRLDREEDARLQRLIRTHTRIVQPPLTPELRIHGADDYASIWSATEAELRNMALRPPFWAFAWAGGQALARWLLDHPRDVAGKTVLAIGAGCGLEAIAAARSGAAESVANDVDPAAIVAAKMNADLNNVQLMLDETNWLNEASLPDADIILAGDVFYEKTLGEQLESRLRAAQRRGAVVLIGDPGRNYAPAEGVKTLNSYAVPVPVELEDVTERVAEVCALC
ncbi:MAG: 50S ribosomal protein L11 methyltransferase [Pseudomonadota bacterium]